MNAGVNSDFVQRNAAHHIRHEYHETEGGYTWINWRLYLRDFSQLLFR